MAEEKKKQLYEYFVERDQIHGRIRGLWHAKYGKQPEDGSCWPNAEYPDHVFKDGAWHACKQKDERG